MSNEYIFVILGITFVTFLPRWIPVFYLTRQNLPDWLIEWLDLIPAAILSAILIPALITSGTPKTLDILRPELFVAIPTLFFAVKTKSLGGTVVVGMILFWLVGIYF